MKPFSTIDANNVERNFQYAFEYGDELRPDMVYFKVYSEPHDPYRYFSYNLKIVNEQTAKGEMMNTNSNSEFSKMGIPERIIEIASMELKKNIISSPITWKAGNYLVGPSKKAWERLVSKNPLAVLDNENDRFILKYEL